MKRLATHLLVVALLGGGCKDEPAPAEGADPAEKMDAPILPVDGEASARPTGPELIAAPAEGEVADIVLRELARAGADDRDLLVYVGADWCDPCKRFHAAVVAGDLDDAFPRLTLLEFDAGRDRERLVDGGYGSRLVPLFAAPGPDGRDSGRRFEGGIKGSGAVDNLIPRLDKLLSAAHADRASLSRARSAEAAR